MLFFISLAVIVNLFPANIAFPVLLSTLLVAVKVTFPAAAIKSLFCILFPLIFTVPPTNLWLFTTSPVAVTVSVCADNSLLLVKLLAVIVVDPVPVVSPLFVIFFPLIVRLCAPCNLPTRFISFVVVKVTLFPLIFPVLSNFLLFCISIVLEAILLVFVIFELLRSNFSLEAILPLFIRFTLLASIFLSAIISLVFLIFCALEKEILLNDKRYCILFFF